MFEQLTRINTKLCSLHSNTKSHQIDKTAFSYCYMYIQLLNGNDTLDFFLINSFMITSTSVVVAVAPDETQAFVDELIKLGAHPQIVPKPEEYQKISPYNDVSYSLEANISIYITGGSV